MMADRILILGASARAAAASARRAGLTPFAIDLFADADTERLCERVWRCPPDRYPHGLFELSKHAPPMPWMYTGGLENYPDLVGELARERELWGNGPEVLRRVRDPQESWELLAQRYLYSAEVLAPGLAPQQPGWLCKPLRGAGGRGIRRATTHDSPNRDVYFQAEILGRPMSVVIFADRSSVTVVGICTQLVGAPWLHTPSFQYAGNVGPIRLIDTRGTFHGLASVLSEDAGLIGPLGVDFIWAEDGTDHTAYAVDINPRYTASTEIHEHATGRLAFAAGLEDSTRPTKIVGKAVYYAPHRITFPVYGPWDDSLARAADVWHRPDFADIPHPGDTIEPGHPVLTILTDADTEAECLRRLQSRAAELDRLFGFVPSPLEGEG